jgi:hypothetical protein
MFAVPRSSLIHMSRAMPVIASARWAGAPSHVGRRRRRRWIAVKAREARRAARRAALSR